MANRLTVRNVATLEKAPVVIYGRVAIGATGAPTLNAVQSKGILSIARTGVGAYTVNLGGPAGVDTYQRLLDFDFISVVATTSTVVSANVVQDNSASASPNVKLQFVSAAGAAAELASGEDLRIKLAFSNSTGA